MLQNITEKLTAYMVGKGITPDEELVFGGDICRFHIAGDSPGKRNGWCALNMGEFTSAVFGSWKTGKSFAWMLKKPTTPEEMKQAKKAQTEARDKYNAGRVQKHKQAAETANILWDKAVPADRSHAYLFEKKIQAHGIRQLEGALLTPMLYGNKIVSLQAIYPTGQKIFLKGGKVKGCYYRIGDLASTIYICEGFATACSIREQYGTTVFAAFTAGNLGRVAQDIAVAYPTAELIIMADNDKWTVDNPGIAAARKAAGMSGATVIIPNFKDLDESSKPTDFNDYVCLGGAL